VMRVTPSLPQRGRQSKGSIPLTPLFISPVSKENFSSTFWGRYRFFSGCHYGKG
jgi:hypothetical protein